MSTQHSPVPLIILDVQDAIDQPVWDGKSNPGYLAAIQCLLAYWRLKGWPVMHIKHDEQAPASTYHVHGPWNGIKREVAPVEGELVIVKQQNCAFIGTELDQVLKGMRVERFVLTGVVIHNSMDATVRAGKALGYHIILPSDSTTAVPVVSADGKSWEAGTVHELTLAILNGEYAEVMTSQEVIALDIAGCADVHAE
ncbi:isochorismatase family protein [Pseudomonas sp. 15FMM2]|uniref:Isochorismatase family protein n=1 Tax=Pseudomonas imrae TaxID=2992837 RepID=A0ACC7PE55_9PSED